jgi:type I restriction enzyme S subunit
MNKILEKLLDGAGVEWVRLGDVADILNGYAFKSLKYGNDGIRVIRISDVQKGKISNKDIKYYPIKTTQEISKYLLNSGDLVMSLTGNCCGRVAMLSQSDLPAALNQRVGCLRPKRKSVLTRYLFHFFDQTSFEIEAMSNVTGGGQKNMSTTWLASYKIPIPCPDEPEKSLKIQAEIVRFLEAFPKLNNEIAARKKQYEYYRDKLLTFKKGDVDFLPLQKVGNFFSGKTITKKDFKKTGVGCIYFSDVYNNYNLYVHKTTKFICEKFSKKFNKGETGDLIILKTAKGFKKLAKAVVWLSAQNIVVSDGLCIFRHKLNPKYVAHFFRSTQCREQIKNNAQGCSIYNIYINNLSEIIIPVPSPKEQARIVNLCERLDVLYCKLENGLNLEAGLREKQIKYYCDMLLDFPRPDKMEEPVEEPAQKSLFNLS